MEVITAAHTESCSGLYVPTFTGRYVINAWVSDRMIALRLTVATPCWPAPVSAMTLFLPMRLQSKACPRELLIL